MYPGFNFPGAPPGIPPINPNDAWQEFTAPDGRKYYYNVVTQENTWNKPKSLVDKEQGSSLNLLNIGPVQLEACLAIKENGTQIDTSLSNAPLFIQSVGYAGFRPSVAMGGAQQALSGAMSNVPNKSDKSRPVSSNAVAGTPWCVVWTGDNRVNILKTRILILKALWKTIF